MDGYPPECTRVPQAFIRKCGVAEEFSNYLTSLTYPPLRIEGRLRARQVLAVVELS